MHTVMKWRWLPVTLFLIVLLAGCKPKTELVPEDVPVRSGTTYETYSNDPNKTTDVAVSFDLKGPWDFSEGPTDAVMESVFVAKAKAADAKQYPQAKLAEKVLPNRLTSDFTTYNFVSVEERALLLYGQSSSPPFPEIKPRVYDKPERLLVFPLKVGTRWTDTFKVSAGTDTTVTARKAVLARGAVTVPAGAFDCYLVQITRMVKEEGETTKQYVYVWWSADVGPVAWIIGEPDGARQTFKRADYFYRLKSYKVEE